MTNDAGVRAGARARRPGYYHSFLMTLADEG